MLVTLALVAGELTHAGQRRWWAARPLTTDTVSGLLVLLITVLVVNHLLTRRQGRQRGHAVAAQAAIIVAQAARLAEAVSSVTGGPGAGLELDGEPPRSQHISAPATDLYLLRPIGTKHLPPQVPLTFSGRFTVRVTHNMRPMPNANRTRPATHHTLAFSTQRPSRSAHHNPLRHPVNQRIQRHAIKVTVPTDIRPATFPRPGEPRRRGLQARAIAGRRNATAVTALAI
jgi:hypothetical protein